jgi:hypothetical protein
MAATKHPKAGRGRIANYCLYASMVRQELGGMIEQLGWMLA